MDMTEKMREGVRERHLEMLCGLTDADGAISIPTDSAEYHRIYAYAKNHGLTIDEYLELLGLTRGAHQAREKHVERLNDIAGGGGVIPYDLKDHDAPLYGTLSAYAHCHGMTYGEYVQSLGFTLQKAPARYRRDIDYDTLGVLVGTYHVSQTEIASWLNVTKQRIGQILLANHEEEYASWLTDSFTSEERRILSDIERNGTRKLDRDGTKYRVFATDGCDSAMAVIKDGSIRVLLPDGIKAADAREEQTANPLSGETVTINGDPRFKPDCPKKFFQEAARRGMSAGALSAEVSGLPLVKRTEKTDADIMNALSRSAENGIIRDGIRDGSTWLYRVAYRRGMTIEAFAASYGFAYVSPEKRADERHMEIFAAYTGADGLTYVPYGADYKVLLSRAQRRGMSVIEYGETLGFTMIDRDGDVHRRHRNGLAAYEKAHGSLDGLSINEKLLYYKLSAYAHSHGMGAPEYIRSLGFAYGKKDDPQEIESFADAVKRETAASGKGNQKQERGRRQEMTMEM